jgi:hypothetical protein
MTSKAERKRRKHQARASITLPGGTTVPQVQTNDPKRERPEDARKTALQARCRTSAALMSAQAVKVEIRALSEALAIDDPCRRKEAVQAVATRVEGIRMKAAALNMAGCGVGRLILAEPEHHRADLWNAAQHARQTQAAYDRAIGAPSRHAQVARILAPVAAFEADASSPAPDFRTTEERVRQATAAQMRVVKDWAGVLACLQCIVEGLRGEVVKVRVR